MAHYAVVDDFRVGMPCVRCGVGQRYVSPKGIVNSWCSPCHRAHAAAWNKAHPKAHAATSRVYRAAHPDRVAEQDRLRAPRRVIQNREWAQRNPHKRRAREERRRAMKLGAFVENVSRAVVWERDGGRCHICREPAVLGNWHLDHVVPLVRGGQHSYANTAVSHPTCNQRKNAKIL